MINLFSPYRLVPPKNPLLHCGTNYYEFRLFAFSPKIKKNNVLVCSIISYNSLPVSYSMRKTSARQ